jgi:hypothetical protein
MRVQRPRPLSLLEARSNRLILAQSRTAAAHLLAAGGSTRCQPRSGLKSFIAWAARARFIA